MKQLLTEKQKIDYLEAFWNGYETLLIKKRLQKRHNNTEYRIKNGTKSRMVSVKKLITLEHERREITFSIEITPWHLESGEVYVATEFVSAKNLVVPKSKIDLSESKVFGPKYDPMTFIARTNQVAYYLGLVETTALDVSLLDNIGAGLEKLLGN